MLLMDLRPIDFISGERAIQTILEKCDNWKARSSMQCRVKRVAMQIIEIIMVLKHTSQCFFLIVQFGAF